MQFCAPGRHDFEKARTDADSGKTSMHKQKSSPTNETLYDFVLLNGTEGTNGERSRTQKSPLPQGYLLRLDTTKRKRQLIHT
eukprot:4367024-Pyramimonas_sp.AAC.1